MYEYICSQINLHELLLTNILITTCHKCLFNKDAEHMCGSIAPNPLTQRLSYVMMQ